MNENLAVIIQAILDKSGIQKDLQEIQKLVGNIIKITPELEAASLKNDLKKVSAEIAKDLNKALNLNLKTNDVYNILSKQLNQTSSSATKLATEMNRLNKVATMQKWADNNTKAMRKFGDEINDIIKKMGNLDQEMTLNDSTTLYNRYKEIVNLSREQGLLGLTGWDKIKKAWEKFGGWGLATGSITKVIHEFKNAVTFSKELSSALTNINYTMDVTASQLEKIGQKSLSMAKDLNTSAENVLGAVKLYANAKETADTILQKAQPAIMLSNVSGFSGEQSAKYLQTIMNQFDMAQDDLMNISDIIQSVSQNMAHDFSDGIVQINEGIETSGEVARAAGMDLAQYASMIGLLVERTGLAGSQLGNAVKTIITRTTKAGKILGIDEGEISDAEKSLKNVGIAVRETDGEFREFQDTMRDLSEVWDDLSDVEKSNIAFNLAGTRQINVIQTLLRNWSDYEDLVVKANESAGVTFENQEKYAESLEGKMEGLSATMTSVWENLINEDSVSPIVNVLSKLADGLDVVTNKFGLLGSISMIGSGIAGAKGSGLTNYVVT